MRHVRAITHGLPAAFAAALLYGVSPVVQAAAARSAPAGRGFGIGLLAGLLRRPLWLAGIACEMVGFVVEVYAFSVAPAALVAPVMATDSLVAALLARQALRERMSASGRVGVLSMALGIGLLAFAFGGDSALGPGASDGQMLLFLTFGVVGVTICARAGHLAATSGRQGGAALLFGAGAGVSYALATLSTRQIGLLLNGGQLWRLLTTPTPYVLIVFSLAGVSLFQRGLQAGGATVTFPITSGLAAFLPVVVSLTVLGEDTPSGAEEVAFVVALALVAGGVTLLGRARADVEAAGPLARADSDSPAPLARTDPAPLSKRPHADGEPPAARAAADSEPPGRQAVADANGDRRPHCPGRTPPQLA